MRLLEKISAIRRSAHIKSSVPETAFLSRLRWPRHILETVEKSDLPTAAKFEARRHYVVILCAAYEIFWRDFMRMCVDEARLGAKQLGHLTKQTYSMADLAEISGKRVTFGELLSYAYTFQSTNVVNAAFSDVFEIDAFGVIARGNFGVFEIVGNNRRKDRKPLTGTILGSDVMKLCPLIEECFQIRHETVHNLGIMHRVTREKVLEFDHAIWFFNRMAGMSLGFEIFVGQAVPIALVGDGGMIKRSSIKRLQRFREKIGIPDMNHSGLSYVTPELIGSVRDAANKSTRQLGAKNAKTRKLS